MLRDRMPELNYRYYFSILSLSPDAEGQDGRAQLQLQVFSSEFCLSALMLRERMPELNYRY
jgi:hypothetical protein